MKFYKTVNNVCSFVTYVMFLITFICTVLCSIGYGSLLSYVSDNVIETTTSLSSLINALSSAVFVIALTILGVATVLFLISSVLSFKYNKLYKTSDNLIYLRKSLTSKGIIFIILIFSRLFTLLNVLFSTAVLKLNIDWILNTLFIVLIILNWVARFKLSYDLKKGRLQCVDGDVITDN